MIEGKAFGAKEILVDTQIQNGEVDRIVDAWRRWRSLDREFRAALRDLHATEDKLPDWASRRSWTRASTESEQQRIDAEWDRSGVNFRQTRADRLQDKIGAIVMKIERSKSTAAPVLAAKLDVALSFGDGRCALVDLPWSPVVSAVRALLPDLPGEMQYALAPIAAGQGTIDEHYG